jgi:hypothetical protein
VKLSAQDVLKIIQQHVTAAALLSGQMIVTGTSIPTYALHVITTIISGAAAVIHCCTKMMLIIWTALIIAAIVIMMKWTNAAVFMTTGISQSLSSMAMVPDISV